MKRTSLLLLSLVLLSIELAAGFEPCPPASTQTLASPDGNFALTFTLRADGQPAYRLDYKDQPVVTESQLGLLTDEAELATGFRLADVARQTVDQTWKPVWGEYSEVRDHYNELLVTLEKEGRRLLVRFRLFDDGLGFRYELPAQPRLNYLTVTDELTAFNLTANHTAFCMPGDYDTNEFAYTTAPISKIDSMMTVNLSKKGYETRAHGGLTVQTPILFKTTDGLYISLHEAALVGYPAMLLNVDDRTNSLTAHLTPDKTGKKGYIQLPFHTPWRTLIVSDDARRILASQLILNLNEPCAIDDTSWIKPMKYVGVWWEMFTGQPSTWAYSDDYRAKPGMTDYAKLTPNGKHAANTAHVKRYIDFAATHGFGGVLVEGWNEGWEDWVSYRKDRQFLFTKPYPDFDIDEIQRYAAAKGVRMIMHHETASNAADYERQLEQAFRYMTDHGYPAVKTGYVGYVIPRSEYHSSQWMNDHYVHVARTAARHRIMVNSHEAVRPTGLCRTWPNWLAQESARGGEFESFGGNDPDHTCILPFNRLKGGPMDYTPGIFQLSFDYYKDGTKHGQRVQTTLAKQLALYLTMPSPIQMAADLPENYERFPDALQFIKDVAVDWDDSWYLEAEPGDYITVARKAKGRDEWFVGGITDEQARVVTISFSFLPPGKSFVATIYEDGKDADWQGNQQSYAIRQQKVSSKSVIKQRLAKGGGVAISIR
ncbi:MAG: glycoside hydrolase family 97 protein [Mediterranea sp.]|nr:glycoside hydrolase family 97 protein [Mediterranea sp.]